MCVLGGKATFFVCQSLETCYGRQAIICTNDDLVGRHIYALLGFNKLKISVCVSRQWLMRTWDLFILITDLGQMKSWDRAGKCLLIPHCLPIVWSHPTSATVLCHGCDNLCKCQYEALKISKRFLSTISQHFTVDHHFCQVPVCFLSRECRFPQLHQRPCGAFVLITFSYEPSLYANYHCKPTWQSCQPISALLLLKILFVQDLGFHRGRCRELMGCCEAPSKKSCTAFLRAVFLPRVTVGTYWR